MATNKFVARNGIVALDNSTITGSLDIAGNLTTTGTITAQKLVVQQVTSSVLYSSGSNIFGNLLSNTQSMTGSVGITGSLSINGVTVVADGVNSFNTRSGSVTLSSGDVTTALTFTPYNATNPSGYITQAQARAALSFTAGSGAYNTTSGVITIPTNNNQLTNGAGYTTNTGTVTSVGGTGTVSGLTLSGTVNTSGNLTLGGTLSLTSGNVTSALGYTPYNATNPSGYISSYTETDTLANVTSRGATTGTETIFTGTLKTRKSQTAGNYTTAALWVESHDNTTTGIAFHISGNVGKFLEMRTDGILYWYGSTVWHSGNLTNLNQLTNGPGYITSYSETDTLATVTARGNTSTGNVNINGTLTATVKSFIIDHPTKEGKRLQYGVLEGPEHSVYVRGKLTNNNTITLPDHWHALVHEDTITVNLTPINNHQNIWVESVNSEYIIVGAENPNIECYYTVFAERKDIDKLITEFDKE